MKDTKAAELVNKLREVKQDTYNHEVDGWGERPTEAIDRVVSALGKVFPDLAKVLFDQVIDFYPDYEPS